MSPERSPPIAQKLMKQKLHGDFAPFLGDIDMKLKKAEENRRKELARQNPQTDD